MASYEKNILDFRNQLSFKGLSCFNLEKMRGAKPDGVIVCGMGGSGIPGLIIKKMAGELSIPVPVVVVRDSSVPKLLFKKPIFVVVSFSGETAETISFFKQAMAFRGKYCVAVVTGGGKLRRIAEKKKLPLVLLKCEDLTPHINLCGGLTPREASGIMFYGIVKVLKAVFPLKVSPFKGFEPLRLKSLGERLARAAKNRNILIYTDYSFAHLGYIWKTNLNETAKIPAFTNIYPELNHNEIAGFEKAKADWMIFWLKQKSSTALNNKIKLISKIIGSKTKNIEILLRGRNLEEKTWNGIILSHWTAFYLAKANGVDPRKTKIIDRMKK